ncbi:hypothetical protein [Actinobacillus pleuropneumoniae]|uniref:hypothetical protein n=1 Tax=Actinobacillus pleuropneumoniae TaxID=715 RepID=UPI00223D7345|nr:hypothetical protein [Actinobacillus pleuropneumoniae]
MKKLLLVSALGLVLTACVSNPYSSKVWKDIQRASTNVHNFEYGNNFDEKLVRKIVKGKTTENQLVALFGEPNNKLVLNEKDSKWLYTYTSTSTESPTYMTGSLQEYQNSVKTTSKTKTLDILVRNGRVVNFALQLSDPKIKTNSETKLDTEKLLQSSKSNNK